jgi:hypothetical protein
MLNFNPFLDITNYQLETKLYIKQEVASQT